ncbi:T9SS type A sorting domain-containing protein [bacterium]|nr:T9SS type A sorting domain-containing protein [bacterium]
MKQLNCRILATVLFLLLAHGALAQDSSGVSFTAKIGADLRFLHAHMYNGDLIGKGIPGDNNRLFLFRYELQGDSALRRTAHIEFEYNIKCWVVRDDRIYGYLNQDGMMRVYEEDPSGRYQCIQELTENHQIKKLSLDGNYLYGLVVDDETQGPYAIRVWAIDETGRLTQAGYHPLEFRPTDMVAGGGGLFIGKHPRWIQIYSLADPANPEWVSSWDPDHWAFRFQWFDYHEDVLRFGNDPGSTPRMYYLDVSDLASPTLLTDYPLDIGEEGRVHFLQNFAVIVDEGVPSELWDISSPAEPESLYAFEGIHVQSASLASEHLLINDTSGSLHLFLLPDGEAPSALFSEEFLPPPVDMALHDSLLVIVDPSAFHVYDLSNPYHPVLTARVDSLRAGSGSLMLRDHVAYLLRNQRLCVADLSDPSEPVLTMNVDPPGGSNTIFPMPGGFALLDPDVRVYTTEDPLYPQRVPAEAFMDASSFNSVEGAFIPVQHPGESGGFILHFSRMAQPDTLPGSIREREVSCLWHHRFLEPDIGVGFVNRHGYMDRRVDRRFHQLRGDIGVSVVQGPGFYAPDGTGGMQQGGYYRHTFDDLIDETFCMDGGLSAAYGPNYKIYDATAILPPQAGYEYHSIEVEVHPSGTTEHPELVWNNGALPLSLDMLDITWLGDEPANGMWNPEVPETLQPFEMDSVTLNLAPNAFLPGDSINGYIRIQAAEHIDTIWIKSFEDAVQYEMGDIYIESDGETYHLVEPAPVVCTGGRPVELELMQIHWSTGGIRANDFTITWPEEGVGPVEEGEINIRVNRREVFSDVGRSFFGTILFATNSETQPVDTVVVHAEYIDPIEHEVGEVDNTTIPDRFVVSTARPNPFNATTILHVGLPFAGTLTVKVYDVLGRHVRTLSKGHRNPGRYLIPWDGTSSSGTTAAAGVYFVRVDFAGELYVQSVHLIR